MIVLCVVQYSGKVLCLSGTVKPHLKRIMGVVDAKKSTQNVCFFNKRDFTIIVHYLGLGEFY